MTAYFITVGVLIALMFISTKVLETMEYNKIYDSIVKTGGATYCLETGLVNLQKGYVASEYGCEYVIKYEDFSRKKFRSIMRGFIQKHSDKLNAYEAYVGAWDDGTQIVLDVSYRFENVVDCIAFCELNKQRAYYDAEAGQAISVEPINEPS